MRKGTSLCATERTWLEKPSQWLSPLSSLFFCQAEAARRKENESVRQQLDLNVRRKIGHLPITER